MNTLRIQSPAWVFRKIARRTGLLRWLTFNTVGLMGVLVQLLSIMTMREWLGLHYLAATALAVEIAILHNFVWHERWTWLDRTAGRRADRLRRLLRFNVASGSVSIGSNVLLTAWLVDWFGLHYLSANLLAITAGSVLNLVATERLVYMSGATAGQEVTHVLPYPASGDDQ